MQQRQDDASIGGELKKDYFLTADFAKTPY